MIPSLAVVVESEIEVVLEEVVVVSVKPSTVVVGFPLVDETVSVVTFSVAGTAFEVVIMAPLVVVGEAPGPLEVAEEVVAGISVLVEGRVVDGFSEVVVERVVTGILVVVSVSFEVVLTSSVVLGFSNVDVPTSVVVGPIVTVLNVVGIVAAAVVVSFTP